MARILMGMFFVGMLVCCGCHSYSIMALPYDASLQSVKVIGHLKNRVDDFPSVLADAFEERGFMSPG